MTKRLSALLLILHDSHKTFSGKTPEGRNATSRVQTSVFFSSFFFIFFSLHGVSQNLFFFFGEASIAARFPETFLIKYSIFRAVFFPLFFFPFFEFCVDFLFVCFLSKKISLSEFFDFVDFY